MLKSDSPPPQAADTTETEEMSYPAMLRVVARLSFRHYKRFAVLMLATGLSAVALEIGAYGVVFGAVAILNGSDMPAFAEQFLVNASGDLRLMAGVAAFFGLMLLSAALHYGAGFIAARCRRVTFADNITRMLLGLTRAPWHGFVKGRGTKEIARALRRDCRYSSLALTEFIALPRPVLIASLCIAVGFVFYPVIASIASLILLLSLPAHIRTGRYGIGIMERLIEEGGRKGLADREVVRSLTASPWSASSENFSAHVQNKDVRGFLDAYENRVALAPVSQLTSRIVSTVVFAAVGAYMFYLYLEGALKLTDALAIVIVFRIFNAAAAEIVQKLVIIVSYSPIMKELFQFFQESGVVDHALSSDATQPPEPTEPDNAPLRFDPAPESENYPQKLGVIDPAGPSHHSALDFSALYQAGSDPILSVPVPLPDDYDIDERQVHHALSYDWKELSEPLKAELRDIAARRIVGSDKALALLPCLLRDEGAETTLVLADARMFLKLTAEDQRQAEAAILKNGPLVLVYSAFPKRYPSSLAGRLFCRIDSTLVPILDEEDFFRRREKGTLSDAGEAGLSAELDDGF